MTFPVSVVDTSVSFGQGLACRPESVERKIPESYVGASLDGSAKLDPFYFEVVNIKWERGPRVKNLVVSAKIKTRSGDFQINNGTLAKAGDFKVIVFYGDFEAGRPDAACIRELLMNALRHELEECIMVDGVRVWDPHVGRPRGI